MTGRVLGWALVGQRGAGREKAAPPVSSEDLAALFLLLKEELALGALVLMGVFLVAYVQWAETHTKLRTLQTLKTDCAYLNNFMTISSTAEMKQTNSLKDTNH